ncbi:GDSL-type esterase/lipase family protein [Bacillus sp. P14.5]|uniref:GDSL-type esterase/lipase family protein n=1 Tax=Bacillus sp. P14.5 TaxID=1983400 RepID=UPI000DE88EC3|nr:GDSL-type esterase/lipase family protein [Bacillus sp. P14.5]
MKRTLYAIVGIIAASALIGWAHYESKEKTIAAFGDSLTYGFGDKGNEGYVDKLESVLNQKYETGPIEIANYGIVGQETNGVLNQLENPETREEASEADGMIVFIGTNDLINSNGGDLHPLQEKKIREGKEDYHKNLTSVLDTLRKENHSAPIHLIGLYNPYPGNKEIQVQIDEWNDLNKKIAADYEGINFIPLDGVFKNKSKEEYFSDSLHPNEKGYKLIAWRILKDSRLFSESL